MNELSEQFPSATKSLAGWRATSLWLASGLAAVLVLSIVAAAAPPEMKRLFVFAAMFGAVCGLVLRWLAAEFPIRRGWFPTSLCGLLILVGAVHLGWLNYRRLANDAARWAREHSEEAAMLRMVQKIAELDPETAKSLESRRHLLDPEFSDYLVHRTQRLGKLAPPWPTVIWLGELLLATTVGLGAFRYRGPEEPGQPTPRESAVSNEA